MNTTRASLTAVCLVVLTLIAVPVSADFTFGTPVHLGPVVNTASGDGVDCISPDGLEMYIDSDRPGGSGKWDIWVATRATPDQDWGPPVNLSPLANSPENDACASISADGLDLYFGSQREGGRGGADLWVTHRSTREAPWGQPVNLGPKVNSASHEGSPRLSADGLVLYFASWRSGGHGSTDIWVARRPTVGSPWETPVNLGAAVNGAGSESFPCLSTDDLALFLSEEMDNPLRPGGCGGCDLWVTTRRAVTSPWSPPVNLGPVINTSAHENGPVLSPDGHTLFFSSERTGGLGGLYGDIYQASIVPIVDFNGDGEVDGKDVRIQTAYLGGSDSLCDIGPFAWGNGVVDIEDVKVLADYIGADIQDPTLLAHWAMDEAEGTIVLDSAGSSKGFAMGNPLWQPEGGRVGGALILDGVDDFVITGHVLGLGAGPFSIVAWVQGGAPGQSLFFHRSGTKWLYVDPLSGSLTADFRGTGRSGPPLVSDVAVTDGLWHRVGLVWDGVSRILYVDGEDVARDSVSGMAIPDNGLMIGGGTGPGTYWSGLIDDVRVYNRIVHP